MVNNPLGLDLLILERKMGYGLFLLGFRYLEVLTAKESNFSEFKISSKNSGANMVATITQDTIFRIYKPEKVTKFGTKLFHSYLNMYIPNYIEQSRCYWQYFLISRSS